VDSRQNRDRLLGDIDTREDGSSLRDSGQPLGKDRGGEMGELEVDVVLLGSDSSTLADLERHRSGDDVSGGEVLGRRGVSLHETLTLGVEEVSSLPSRSWRKRSKVKGWKRRRKRNDVS
jgi:hypothetical protein